MSDPYYPISSYTGTPARTKTPSHASSTRSPPGVPLVELPRSLVKRHVSQSSTARNDSLQGHLGRQLGSLSVHTNSVGQMAPQVTALVHQCLGVISSHTPSGAFPSPAKGSLHVLSNRQYDHPHLPSTPERYEELALTQLARRYFTLADNWSFGSSAITFRAKGTYH